MIRYNTDWINQLQSSSDCLTNWWQSEYCKSQILTTSSKQFNSRGKSIKVDFELLRVLGLRQQRECPGMSPSSGKYLPCQSFDRATLKKRKEISDPPICFSPQLVKWKKCVCLTCAMLSILWCVCAYVYVFVQTAHQHESVRSEQQTECSGWLLLTLNRSVSIHSSLWKYSTTLLNLSRELLGRLTAPLLTKCLTSKEDHTLQLATASSCGSERGLDIPFLQFTISVNVNDI